MNTLQDLIQKFRKKGVDKTPFIVYNVDINQEREERKMNRREYFTHDELKEKLIVAENFGCMAEVLADLGMTAEEAKKIIWDED